MIAHCVLNTFLKAIFTAGLDSQHNWRKDIPSTLAPAHYQPPLTVVFTTVTTERPTLTRQNHPKSTAYRRAHAWCCIVFGFQQMCSDMYALLEYHRIFSQP